MSERLSHLLSQTTGEQSPFSCRGIYCRVPEQLPPLKQARIKELKPELYQAVQYVSNWAISFKPRYLQSRLWTIADTASWLSELGVEVFLPGAIRYDQHIIQYSLDSGQEPEIWSFWHGSSLDVKSLQAMLHMPSFIMAYPKDKPEWKIYPLTRHASALDKQQLLNK